jgi:hypothetical protein
MAFHSHHVPQGVIKLKKKEFQDLKQGSMMVSEFVTRFTQLPVALPMMWILMRRSKSVSSMDWMMDLPTLWKHNTLRTFKP